jgi:hypothetical protein
VICKETTDATVALKQASSGAVSWLAWARSHSTWATRPSPSGAFCATSGSLPKRGTSANGSGFLRTRAAANSLRSLLGVRLQEKQEELLKHVYMAEVKCLPDELPLVLTHTTQVRVLPVFLLQLSDDILLLLMLSGLSARRPRWLGSCLRVSRCV